MYLDQRINYFAPAAFAGVGNTAALALLGTTQKFAIDRTWPIEEIILHVNFTLATAITSGQLATNGATTPDHTETWLNLIQKVNLSVNDGKQPRSVVDCSGVGLLHAAYHLGFNNDESTSKLMALSQPNVTAYQATYNGGGTFNNVGATLGAPIFPVGNYALSYRIPMVEPWIGEPLRSRMYLPVHTYPQDPVLSVTFNNGTNLMGNSSTALTTQITNVWVEIELIRRVPTAASEQLLRSTAGTNPNGYIDWDFIETPFSVAPGISAEQRFALPVPGQYANMLFRHYLGGAVVTKNVIDNSGIGNTSANGLGAESRWRLETGLVVLREWKWKHLKNINDMSRGFTPVAVFPVGSAAAASVHVNYGIPGATMLIPGSPPTLAGVAFRAADSVKLDFLNDGLSGDTGIELGSLLDCNTPANNGLKMEIIGAPANVATNASYLYVTGRRYFGDLSRWSKFA